MFVIHMYAGPTSVTTTSAMIPACSKQHDLILTSEYIRALWGPKPMRDYCDPGDDINH